MGLIELIYIRKASHRSPTGMQYRWWSLLMPGKMPPPMHASYAAAAFHSRPASCFAGLAQGIL